MSYNANRNADYKLRSLRNATSQDARAQRIDLQNDNRRKARQAASNAKRGLSEIDTNSTILNSPKNEATPEQSHDSKLRERLERLKLWRENKLAAQQKAKAKKKVPFLVPGVARLDKPVQDTRVLTKTGKQGKETNPPKPLAGRVTRSQARNAKWTVTATKPTEEKENKKKKEAPSFAPKNFVFTAPAEMVLKLNTPQKPLAAEAKGVEEFKISPLLINNPWITMTRGSSSKKQRKSESNTPVRDVQSSPVLKRRSNSNDKPATETVAETVVANDELNEKALHFRTLISNEESRLNKLCEEWNLRLCGDVPEEESGTVRTVIGQAQLLQRERFTQFAGLVDQFENKSGEKEITATDLEGFWEMIYLQVLDVDRKFEDLSSLMANGWIKPEPVFITKTKSKKKVVGGARPIVKAAKSNMRAIIAAARKNQMACQSPRSPSIMKRRSSSVFSPARTPGKRQSMRRSLLLGSAKKTAFIVTELLKNSDNDVQSSSPCTTILNTVVIPGLSQAQLTPTHKTYGKVHEVPESPKERLSAAFDALKTVDGDHCEFRSPAKAASVYKVAKMNSPRAGKFDGPIDSNST